MFISSSEPISLLILPVQFHVLHEFPDLFDVLWTFIDDLGLTNPPLRFPSTVVQKINLVVDDCGGVAIEFMFPEQLEPHLGEILKAQFIIVSCSVKNVFARAQIFNDLVFDLFVVLCCLAGSLVFNEQRLYLGIRDSAVFVVPLALKFETEH